MATKLIQKRVQNLIALELEGNGDEVRNACQEIVRMPGKQSEAIWDAITQREFDLNEACRNALLRPDAATGKSSLMHAVTAAGRNDENLAELERRLLNADTLCREHGAILTIIDRFSIDGARPNYNLLVRTDDPAHPIILPDSLFARVSFHGAHRHEQILQMQNHILLLLAHVRRLKQGKQS